MNRGKTVTRKGKTEIGKEKRDLFEEGLGQNKVLYSSSTKSNCLCSTIIQAPRRSLHQGNRSPATCRLLTLENRTNSDFSLLPYLAYLLARFIGCPCFRFAGS